MSHLAVVFTEYFHKFWVSAMLSWALFIFLFREKYYVNFMGLCNKNYMIWLMIGNNLLRRILRMNKDSAARNSWLQLWYKEECETIRFSYPK